MLLALQIVLASCFAGVGIGLFFNVKKNRMADFKKATGKQWGAGFAVGIICNFLDTLGCGSYAPSTFLYKLFGTIDDIDIPGTLNIGDTFPVIFEAFIFTASVECDPVFLVSMCVAAAIGSFGFATVVTKWDRNKIRWALGIAMPCLAIVMLCRNIGSIPKTYSPKSMNYIVVDGKEVSVTANTKRDIFGNKVLDENENEIVSYTIPSGLFGSKEINPEEMLTKEVSGTPAIDSYPGFIQALYGPCSSIFGRVGDSIGFIITDWRFCVAVLLNVLWGALMDIGFGLYAPCMATCLLLGINPATSFPIFMGSCALLMPACSIEFLKTHRYDVPHTIGNAVGGCIGVFIAWKIVTSLPLFWLINLVCVVLFWTSYMLINSAIKETKKK